MTVTLGSLFQCPTALLLKNLFLTSSLTLPWCSSVLFPRFSGHQREKILFEEGVGC